MATDKCIGKLSLIIRENGSRVRRMDTVKYGKATK